jgi:chorismate synthase
VRCPDAAAAARFDARIRAVRKAGDSIGGVVACVVRNVPAGLGEPVFDKLDALLGGALLSLPAAKGVEIGAGFDGVTMLGSEHNDAFEATADGVRTRTNRAGGVLGGISSGMPLTVRVAFKPVATIPQDQDGLSTAGEVVRRPGRGRHDPCVLPRAVPLVEAEVLLVLADLFLQQRARAGLFVDMEKVHALRPSHI